jgi:hypothetical protein
VTLSGVPGAPSPATSTPNPAVPALPPVPAPANGYAIEGVVKDTATGSPVSGAQVLGIWNTIVQTPGTMSYRQERHEIRGDVHDAGRFRIEVVGSPPPQIHTFALSDESLQVIRAERQQAGLPDATAPQGRALVDVHPGSVTTLVLWARRVFRVRGVVQDAGGRPLENVQYNHVVPQVGHGGALMMGNSMGTTRADGQFDIGPVAEDPLAGIPESLATHVRRSASIVFKHPSYATLRVDPREIAEDQRRWLVVTMTEGATLAGTLVGPRGHPVAGAAVVVEYGDAWDLRRGVRTDGDGRWRLERLSLGAATLHARASRDDLKAKRDLVIAADDLDVHLVAEEVRLERPHPTTTILGLSIAEVDEELRQAFEVPEYVKLVILDPGPEFRRLGIGDLERGYGIWHIGKTPVASVREMLDRLIDSASAISMDERGRIVYTFWNERMTGTNTQHLRLNAEQVEELRALRDRLAAESDR